jgi:hypothetical protein
MTISAGLADRSRLARSVTGTLGGCFSTELGIDVDAGEDEVERWFLAATLFGTRIGAGVAERTFRVLEAAGLERIDQARHILWDDLVSWLDQGGYARYDFRMAARLQELSEIIDVRYGGQVAVISRRFVTYQELTAALGNLPGWGPVTIELFLRELRGVWPAAQPPLDRGAARAARHLGLTAPAGGGMTLADLASVAAVSGLDIRDLETALVRLDLAHRRRHRQCPGGASCSALAQPGEPEQIKA